MTAQQRLIESIKVAADMSCLLEDILKHDDWPYGGTTMLDSDRIAAATLISMFNGLRQEST